MRQPAVPGVGPLAICPTAVGADVHVLRGDTQDEDAQGAHETHDPRLDLVASVRGMPSASIGATYDEEVFWPVADQEEDAEGVSSMRRGFVDVSPLGARHAARRQDIADVEAYARRRHCPGRSSLVGQAEAAYGGSTARPKQSLCFWEEASFGLSPDGTGVRMVEVVTR